MVKSYLREANLTVKTEREKSFDAAKEYNRLLVRSAKYDSQDTDFYGQRTEVVIHAKAAIEAMVTMFAVISWTPHSLDENIVEMMMEANSNLNNQQIYRKMIARDEAFSDRVMLISDNLVGWVTRQFDERDW